MLAIMKQSRSFHYQFFILRQWLNYQCIDYVHFTIIDTKVFLDGSILNGQGFTTENISNDSPLLVIHSYSYVFLTSYEAVDETTESSGAAISAVP